MGPSVGGRLVSALLWGREGRLWHAERHSSRTWTDEPRYLCRTSSTESALNRSRSAAIADCSASRNASSVREFSEVGGDDLDTETVARQPPERRFVADLAAPEPVAEEEPAVGTGLVGGQFHRRLEPIRSDGSALGIETELDAEDVGGVHRGHLDPSEHKSTYPSVVSVRMYVESSPRAYRARVPPPAPPSRDRGRTDTRRDHPGRKSAVRPGARRQRARRPPGRRRYHHRARPRLVRGFGRRRADAVRLLDRELRAPGRGVGAAVRPVGDQAPRLRRRRPRP